MAEFCKTGSGFGVFLEIKKTPFYSQNILAKYFSGINTMASEIHVAQNENNPSQMKSL